MILYYILPHIPRKSFCMKNREIKKTVKSHRTNTEEMNIPLIVRQDGYLAPLTDAIKYKMNHWMEVERRITDGKSLADFANGHKYFGLHKNEMENLWYFREWAPNAYAIFFIGDFSGWHERAEYQLQRISESGIWELKIPGNYIKHLDRFRLKIYWDRGMGERIPTYANYVVQDENTKGFNATVWSPEQPYKFINQSPIFSDAPIIYEAHVGMSQADYKVSSYNEFSQNVLPKVVAAGYNVLQIMAIQEHPYYGSFGYQVSNFFAPSSRFGTPDDLKALIDKAHGYGLKVIMDIVHSHAVKNEVEGLGKFDGTAHQFFHDGGKGDHPAWDTKCFNYGKDEVIHFLLSNCKYWMEEFRFDGFRFDGVTSMLYFHHGLGKAFLNYYDYFNHEIDLDAVTYLTLANKLIHQIKTDAITVAEDVSGMPGIGVLPEHGGLGFDFRLGMGLPDFWIKLLKGESDENWSVDAIWSVLSNFREDEKTIFYSESHDQALVGDKTIIFWLMDKEMYTNMSIFNRNLAVDRGLALHKMIRLITIATGRGGYLNFMGNEFGHPEWIDFPREGNGWSYKYARRQWNLVEDENLCYKFLAQFDREMVNFVRDYKLLDADKPIMIHSHCDNHLIAFERGNNILFVFNFHPHKSFYDYKITVLEGEYIQLFNSDSYRFGGYENIKEHQIHITIKNKKDKNSYLSLYLPPRTVQILKKI